MNTDPTARLDIPPSPDANPNMSRRGFLKTLALAGATGVTAFALGESLRPNTESEPVTGQLVETEDQKERGKAIAQEALREITVTLEGIFGAILPDKYDIPLHIEPWDGKLYSVQTPYKGGVIRNSKTHGLVLSRYSVLFSPAKPDPNHPLNVAHGTLQWTSQNYTINSLDDEHPVLLSEIKVSSPRTGISELSTVGDIASPISHSPTRMVISDENRLSSVNLGGRNGTLIETVGNDNRLRHGFDPFTLAILQKHVKDITQPFQ